MNNHVLKVIAKSLSLIAYEWAQSLPEYALAVTAVGLGCVAGMSVLATSISQVFITVSTVISPTQ